MTRLGEEGGKVGRSQRNTRVTLVPTKHSFRDGAGNLDCCHYSSPLWCVCSWALWCMSLSPGRESYHTVNYQIIAGAFIWDQVAICDRRLIPSSQNPGWKCHKLRQLLGEFSGILLQVRNRIQPTNAFCKLLISAVTHGGVHLFRPDHHAGHSLVTYLFADHPSLHVYLQLLARLLPASSRQPGPVAVLLG